MKESVVVPGLEVPKRRRKRKAASGPIDFIPWPVPEKPTEPLTMELKLPYGMTLRIPLHAPA